MTGNASFALVSAILLGGLSVMSSPSLKAQPTPCIDPSCSVLEDFSEWDKSIERQMTETVSCPNDNIYYEGDNQKCRSCPAGYRVQWDPYGVRDICKRK